MKNWPLEEKNILRVWKVCNLCKHLSFAIVLWNWHQIIFHLSQKTCFYPSDCRVLTVLITEIYPSMRNARTTSYVGADWLLIQSMELLDWMMSVSNKLNRRRSKDFYAHAHSNVNSIWLYAHCLHVVNTFLLPVSHWFPVYPGKHSHSYPPVA